MLSRRDDEIIDTYLEARLQKNDTYGKLVRTKSAHASEAAILQLFWWLWIILLSGTLIHLLWHLAHPSWRPV